MDTPPVELLVHILRYLSYGQRATARDVCTLWRILLDDSTMF